MEVFRRTHASASLKQFNTPPSPGNNYEVLRRTHGRWSVLKFAKGFGRRCRLVVNAVNPSKPARMLGFVALTASLRPTFQADGKFKLDHYPLMRRPHRSLRKSSGYNPPYEVPAGGLRVCL